MICPDCAVRNDQYARYCQGCGRSFLQDQTPSQAKTNTRLSQTSTSWSIWSIASAIFLFLVCLMLPVLFAQWSRAPIGLWFVVIGLVISITSGQLALVDISYNKSNRLSFWIAVMSLLIGYFLLLGSFVVTMVFVYLVANWN